MKQQSYYSQQSHEFLLVLIIKPLEIAPCGCGPQKPLLHVKLMVEQILLSFPLTPICYKITYHYHQLPFPHSVTVVWKCAVFKVLLAFFVVKKWLKSVCLNLDALVFFVNKNLTVDLSQLTAHSPWYVLREKTVCPARGNPTDLHTAISVLMVCLEAISQ